MKTEYRRQETEYSKIRGVTMAEVDAYYEGLLKEIKELQNLLDERTPVESTTLSPVSRGIPRGRGNKNGQKSREEINSRG